MTENHNDDPGMSAESEHHGQSGAPRTHTFDTSGPIEMTITNGQGRVAVELVDSDTTVVELRHDRHPGEADWRDGVANLLGWVSERFNEAGVPLKHQAETHQRTGANQQEQVAEALRRTIVDFSEDKLTIRNPQAAPLRAVPIAITVKAPRGSRIRTRTSSGQITLSGTAEAVDLQTGNGAISLEHAQGRATVQTGSGALHLGDLDSGGDIRTGNGTVDIAAVSGSSTVNSSTGNVALATVNADVLVRTGSGNITVTEATTGQAELISGSGELNVTIPRGVTAYIDLTTTTGTASTPLTVLEQEPATPTSLRISGRTGSGNVLVDTRG